MGPGYLDPDLLPVDLVRAAHARACVEYGSAALAYGNNRGELGLRTALAARAAADGVPCGADQVLVTAGTSHALYLLATCLGAPGDTAVVEQTGYDFGHRILSDCGLRPRPVRTDDAGPDPRSLDDVLSAERALGHRTAFVYLNPSFHNPTGIVVPSGRRRELLAVAARHGALVVEDDAYAELGLTAPRPPSMAELARYRGVIRLGTFSKTIGPGLRLGWLLASTAVVDRLVGHGVFVSGGSANHLTSLAVGTLLGSGEYDRHLGWLRDGLRARRDALSAALAVVPEELAVFQVPDGGYFLWLTATGGQTEADLLAAADRAGVAVAAGSRFGRPARASIRLSYSFAAPTELADAGCALAHELLRRGT